MTTPPIPTRLRAFVEDATADEDDDHLCVTIRLRCPRCEGAKFVLHWQHLREAGRIIETSPVWIECAACRYYALLFDSGCDGYSGFWDQRPAEIPECKVKAYEVPGLASYAVEAYAQYDKDEDGTFHANAEGRMHPDAYDWFSILVEQPDGSMDGAIDFETA